MKLQRNTMFAVSGAAAAAILAFVGLLVWRGMNELSTAQAELEDGKARLQGIYQTKPFPSPQNVARERQNTAALTQWLADLLSVLSKGQIESQEKSPSTFMGLLRDKNSELRQAALRRTAIPEKFAFGFDRYFAPDSSLPVPDAVPALTQQLLIIESLCQVLFDEQVLSLTAIQRDEVEGEPAAAAASAAAAGPADAAAKEGLYTTMRFGLQFRASEKSLIGVLNRLARHDAFVTVTRVSCTKDGSDIHPTARAGAGGGEMLTGAELKGLTRRARMVCGPSLAAPMNVELGVEVYRFSKGE